MGLQRSSTNLSLAMVDSSVSLSRRYRGRTGLIAEQKLEHIEVDAGGPARSPKPKAASLRPRIAHAVESCTGRVDLVEVAQDPGSELLDPAASLGRPPADEVAESGLPPLLG